MNAIAISNFPDDFNEEKLRPEFESRDVNIWKFYTGPDFKGVTIPAEVEAVYCFIDLMSHNQYQVAKGVANKQGRKFHMLTRKVATWPNNTFGTAETPEVKIEPVKEETVTVDSKKRGAPKSVCDEDLVPMLNRFIELSDMNATQEEMIKDLAKFWTGRPLNTYGQLYNYVNRVTDCGTTPDFFAKWVNLRKAKAATGTQIPPVVEPAVQPEPEKSQVVEQTVELPIQEKVLECAEMLKLYEEENAKLHAEIARHKAAPVPVVPASNDRVKKIAQACKMLVDVHAMTYEAAFNMILNNT